MAIGVLLGLLFWNQSPPSHGPRREALVVYCAAGLKPVVEAVAGLTRVGIRAELSLSAGAFVCNHVFYGLMHAAAKNRRIRSAGFVHVPGLPAANADAALCELVRALQIVLRVTQRSI